MGVFCARSFRSQLHLKLEIGEPHWQTTIADVLVCDIVRFAQRRVASHVVCQALTHCTSDGIRHLADALLSNHVRTPDLWRKEYPSFAMRAARQTAHMVTKKNNSVEAAPLD